MGEEEVAAVEKKKKRKRQDDDNKLAKAGNKKKEARAKKKAEKEAALAKVPKVDNDGIAYTKIQIKRMVKRVKRGLPPVPTEEEERERIKMLKQEEEETRNELAGMLHQRQEEKIDDDNDDEANNESTNADDGDDDDDENVIDNTDKPMDDGGGEGADPLTKEPDSSSSTSQQQPSKKKARSKPVPNDYVCFACKNQHLPLHWIYDCPDKVYQPGTNQKKKKLRGMNDPSSRKVFVSGLPFEAKTKEVETYFEQKCGGAKVVHCKLILFPDTKRCKGNGFVTFDTDEGATKALALHGETFSSSSIQGETTTKTKKELKLGVKRVRNRSETKK